MNKPALRLIAALVALTAVQTACFNSYTISTDELSNLDSSHIARSVVVKDDSGMDVTVSATTPIKVQTAARQFSVSPFNFALTESQLVAPDYDLLLSREDVTGAVVSEFNPTKTWTLAAGGLLAAVGTFVLIGASSGSSTVGN